MLIASSEALLGLLAYVRIMSLLPTIIAGRCVTFLHRTLCSLSTLFMVSSAFGSWAIFRKVTWFLTSKTDDIVLFIAGLPFEVLTGDVVISRARGMMLLRTLRIIVVCLKPLPLSLIQKRRTQWMQAERHKLFLSGWIIECLEKPARHFRALFHYFFFFHAYLTDTAFPSFLFLADRAY